MKTRLEKKAEAAHEFPILLILLIVAAVILFIVFFPMIKDWFKNFLVLMGISEEKDTFIRSFDVEQGLEGALIFRFRLINDQDIAGYALNSTKETGDTKLGVIPVTYEEAVTEVNFDDNENLRKDYLLNGKEVKETLPAPVGLDAKKYTLFAVDSSGKVLQKKSVDWPGMFEDQGNYLPYILSFMDLAKGLKGMGSSKVETLQFSKEVVMLGFSKAFNGGACAYQKFNWASGLVGCGHVGIEMPKECADVNSCLCLCRRVNKIEEYCSRSGRICYGYDEFEFIGGSRRTCGTEGWFGKSQGKDGEDNDPVNTWQGHVFDDPNEEFNALAIVINDESESRLALTLTPGTKSIFSGRSARDIKSLVISK